MGLNWVYNHQQFEVDPTPQSYTFQTEKQHITCLLCEGQMRRAEWINELLCWIWPSPFILLSLPIFIWPLHSSLFLLCCSTIGTIVSINVICCFWGAACSDTWGIPWNMCILVQRRFLLNLSFHNMLFCPYTMEQTVYTVTRQTAILSLCQL